MPIVTIVTNRNNSETKRVEAQSGGCFGFMASTSFFRDHRRDVEYVGYHMESSNQAKHCSEVFDGKNKLFPYHKFMTNNEFHAMFGENFVDTRHGTVSHHGYVVVEMQPEGFEGVGIPQDMFISGLFTARQLSYGLYPNMRDTIKKGVHPMMAYVISELIQWEDTSTALAAQLRWKRQRVSSSNIDSTAFGKKNLINMFNCLKGKKHVPYFGHEGGIIQRGGYKRDHNFNTSADNRPGIYQTITANMNTSSAPIEADEPIINPFHFSPAYLGHVLNELLGCEVFDMSKMLDRQGMKVNPKSSVYKFYQMRDVKFRKSYRKGDMVEVRADMFGADQYINRHNTPLSNLVSYRHGENNTTNRVGFVPVKTHVEKVSVKNGVESVKLENGCWVSPRYIKTAGTHAVEGVKIQAGTDTPVNALYTVRNSKEVYAARTFDLFEASVRLIQVTGNSIGQEIIKRPRDLIPAL
ncbi:hypothetical protein [Escherichia phage PJNS034]